MALSPRFSKKLVDRYLISYFVRSTTILATAAELLSIVPDRGGELDALCDSFDGEVSFTVYSSPVLGVIRSDHKFGFGKLLNAEEVVAFKVS